MDTELHILKEILKEHIDVLDKWAGVTQSQQHLINLQDLPSQEASS